MTAESIKLEEVRFYAIGLIVGGLMTGDKDTVRIASVFLSLIEESFEWEGVTYGKGSRQNE